MDPADIERRITSRTEVLLPVDLAGAACDMGRIRDIADRHDLLLSEDCA